MLRCSMSTPTPSPLVRLARIMRRDRVTPHGERARRKLAAVGRGLHLGLDLLPDVTLVRMSESGDPALAMLPGRVLVEVWGEGDSAAVLYAVERNRPANVDVMVVWRPAARWHRVVAWWRYFSAELLGTWAQRVEEISATIKRRGPRA